jgi:hypothetical protein
MRKSTNGAPGRIPESDGIGTDARGLLVAPTGGGSGAGASFAAVVRDGALRPRSRSSAESPARAELQK